MRRIFIFFLVPRSPGRLSSRFTVKTQILTKNAHKIAAAATAVLAIVAVWSNAAAQSTTQRNIAPLVAPQTTTQKNNAPIVAPQTLPVPMHVRCDVNVQWNGAAYIRLSNDGVATIPAGTRVHWVISNPKFDTQHYATPRGGNPKRLEGNYTFTAPLGRYEEGLTATSKVNNAPTSLPSNLVPAASTCTATIVPPSAGSVGRPAPKHRFTPPPR
jgi:hypothetical protein